MRLWDVTRNTSISEREVSRNLVNYNIIVRIIFPHSMVLVTIVLIVIFLYYHLFFATTLLCSKHCLKSFVEK